MTVTREDSLSTARAVRDANKRDREDRDSVKRRVTEFVCEELDVSPDMVEVDLYGLAFDRVIIHVWESGKPGFRVSKKYTLKD